EVVKIEVAAGHREAVGVAGLYVERVLPRKEERADRRRRSDHEVVDHDADRGGDHERLEIGGDVEGRVIAAVLPLERDAAGRSCRLGNRPTAADTGSRVSSGNV